MIAAAAMPIAQTPMSVNRIKARYVFDDPQPSRRDTPTFPRPRGHNFSPVCIHHFVEQALAPAVSRTQYNTVSLRGATGRIDRPNRLTKKACGRAMKKRFQIGNYIREQYAYTSIEEDALGYVPAKKTTPGFRRGGSGVCKATGGHPAPSHTLASFTERHKMRERH